MNFRLVASPNNWSRQSRRTTGLVEGVSGKRAAYQSFFQGLIDELRDEHRFTNAKAAQPQNWYSFSSGVRGFTYGMSFAQGGELRSEICIDVGDAASNETAFDAFEADKSGIEAGMGADLRWERLQIVNSNALSVSCATRHKI